MAQLPLTVFPAIQDKEVTPGEKTRIQIQFRNSGEDPIPGVVGVADYVITDKTGTPRLVENGKIKPKYGAASWIKPAVGRITLPANDFVTVDLYVTVPKDISSCGHYAVVYFETEPNSVPLTIGGNRESASVITNKIGGLVNFTTSSLNCTENAQLNNFKLPQFLEHGPVTVNFDILNLSDAHITPQGVVIAQNMLGRNIDQQTLKEQRIFPEAAKSYTSKIGEKWMIGKYTFTVMASYGTQNKRLTQTVSVIIFPWKEVAIGILGLIIIILLLHKAFKNVTHKEQELRAELVREQSEIEQLKEQLKKRPE